MKKTAKDRGKRARRRLKLGVALAIVFILSLLVVFFFQTRPFSSWLLGRINHNLNLHFGLKVEVDSLKIDPWRLRLEAKNARLVLVEPTASLNSAASQNSIMLPADEQAEVQEEDTASSTLSSKPQQPPVDRSQPGFETRRQADSPAKGNLPLLSIRKLAVNLSGFSLLRHRVYFQEILIDEPALTLRQLAVLKRALPVLRPSRKTS